jgi:hypothetical protein
MSSLRVRVGAYLLLGASTLTTGYLEKWHHEIKSVRPFLKRSAQDKMSSDGFRLHIQLGKDLRFLASTF